MKLKVHENRKNKLQSLCKNLKTIFVLAFVVIVSSCSKSDDMLTQETVAQKYRIKEIIKNGSYTIFCTYNNRNQITKIAYSDQNYTENYEYNSNGYLTRFEGKDDSPSSSSFNQVTTYTNDNQGKVLSSIKLFSSNFKIKTENTYTNSFLTETNTFERNSTDTEWVPSDKTVYNNNSSGFPVSSINTRYNPVTLLWALYLGSNTTYNSSNLVILKTSYSNNSAETKTINEYDAFGSNITKQIFVKTITNPTFIKIYDGAFTKDNVKPVVQDYMQVVLPGVKNPNSLFTTFLDKNSKVSRFGEDDGVLNSTTTDNYTYEYNKDGYVTKTFNNVILKTTYVLELAN